MEDKNSHKIDINGPSSELKSDISDILSRTKEHRENVDEIDISGHTENICEIIVSQYIDDQHVNDNNYAVTYSSDDKSILGWTVNIEENEQQQPDVYFKLDRGIDLSVLCNKTFVFNYFGFGDGKYLF